jgi:hypothetical protein
MKLSLKDQFLGKFLCPTLTNNILRHCDFLLVIKGNLVPNHPKKANHQEMRGLLIDYITVRLKHIYNIDPRIVPNAAFPFCKYDGNDNDGTLLKEYGDRYCNAFQVQRTTIGFTFHPPPAPLNRSKSSDLPPAHKYYPSFKYPFRFFFALSLLPILFRTQK